jgi:hypothetical protein
MVAVGTASYINTRELEKQGLPGGWFVERAIVIGFGRRLTAYGRAVGVLGEKTPRLLELRVDVAGGMQTEVTDFGKSRRQHVVEEAADKLDRGNGNRFAAFGREAHAVLVEGLEPLVGDAYAMSIAPKIAKNSVRSGEGALGVDDPGRFVQAVDQPTESNVISQEGGRSDVLEHAVLTEPP